MSACSFRSAWSDPDHVRLAMYRSWWDENVGTSARGPLPAGEDPWISDPHRALRETGGTR
jgi:hypothetical protein